MANFATDCPHCKSKRASFTVSWAAQPEARGDVCFPAAGKCSICRRFVLFLFTPRRDGGKRLPPLKELPVPSNDPKLGLPEGMFVLNATYPASREETELAAVPENVVRAFRDGEKAEAAGSNSGAAACYRKAVERAVKELKPVGKELLFDRIKAIVKTGVIPASLAEFAHQVRAIGNDSVHEIEYEPTPDEVRDAREFSELFCLYAFTMPARVEAAKARRAERSD